MWVWVTGIGTTNPRRTVSHTVERSNVYQIQPKFLGDFTAGTKLRRETRVATETWSILKACLQPLPTPPQAQARRAAEAKSEPSASQVQNAESRMQMLNAAHKQQQQMKQQQTRLQQQLQQQVLSVFQQCIWLLQFSLETLATRLDLTKKGAPLVVFAGFAEVFDHFVVAAGCFLLPFVPFNYLCWSSPTFLSRNCLRCNSCQTPPPCPSSILGLFSEAFGNVPSLLKVNPGQYLMVPVDKTRLAFR